MVRSHVYENLILWLILRKYRDKQQNNFMWLYQQLLIRLKLLPLMYIYMTYMADIMFFISFQLTN